jgi:hypothetical protein
LNEILADQENRLDVEVEASGFGGEHGDRIIDVSTARISSFFDTLAIDQIV